MQSIVTADSARVVCSDLRIRADRSLLSDFSWEHIAGGIAWLAGTNGSGKSSLLRVLAGWQAPTGGAVSWPGLRAGRIRYFNPGMSAGGDLRVGDFVALIQSITNASSEDEVSALYPATVPATQRFGKLSTGEAKRILLWALLRSGDGPLLLDEPYEHLSRDAKDTLTGVLRQCAAHAVVIVATNQDVSMRENDALLTFNGDRIEVSHAS